MPFSRWPTTFMPPALLATTARRSSPTTTRAGMSLRSSIGRRSTGAPPKPAAGASQAKTAVAGSVQFTPGDRASLSPSDGHVALVPAQAPPVVQAMVIAGNELQDLPYGPTGHPDPRGAYSEDCSSTLNYVLYRSGVRPICRNRAPESARPGLRPLGRTRARAVGDDLRDHQPHRSRIRHDRRAAPRHVPPRHRRRPQPRPRRPPLAHPRPHPNLGSLDGAAPAGVVMSVSWPLARSTIC